MLSCAEQPQVSEEETLAFWIEYEITYMLGTVHTSEQITVAFWQIDVKHGIR